MSKLVFVLSILVIAIVTIGAFYTWEYGDDYLNMVKMRSFGFFDYIWHLYLKWDGRVLSPAGVILILFLKIGSAPLAVFMYLLVYAVCIVIAWKIIRLWWQTETFGKGAITAFYAAFLVGTWPLYKDVVYWLTGGYYSVFLLQGLIIFWWYSKQALANLSKFEFNALKALLVFLLALNTQNLLLPLALVMGIHTLYIWFKINNSKLGYSLILQYLLPVFLGMLVVSIAPGNWARIEAEASTASVQLGFSIGAVVKMLLRFAVYSKWTVVAGLVMGIAFVSKPAKWSFKQVLMILMVCVAMAVVSLSPFFLTPFLARIRVYYFGTLFLLLGFIPVGVFFRQWITSLFPLVNNSLRFVPMILFLIYGAIFFIGQLRLMIPFSTEVASRNHFMESKRGSRDIVHYQRLELPGDFYLIRWADYKRYGNWDQTKEFYQLGGYVEDEPTIKAVH